MTWRGVSEVEGWREGVRWGEGRWRECIPPGYALPLAGPLSSMRAASGTSAVVGQSRQHHE